MKHIETCVPNKKLYKMRNVGKNMRKRYVNVLTCIETVEATFEKISEEIVRNFIRNFGKEKSVSYTPVDKHRLRSREENAVFRTNRWQADDDERGEARLQVLP